MPEKKAKLKKARRGATPPPKLALDKPDKTVIKALALGGMWDPNGERNPRTAARASIRESPGMRLPKSSPAR